MKMKLIFILYLLNIYIVLGQQNDINSSIAILKLRKGDTTEVNALAYLGNQQTQVDSAISYAQRGLLLAQKLNYRKGEADCLLVFAGFTSRQNNFSQAIKYCLRALNIFEDLEDKIGIASAHLILQAVYREIRDYKNSLIHAFSGEAIAEANEIKGTIVFPEHRLSPLFLAEIAQTYILKNQPDSAEIYVKKSIAQNEIFNGTSWNFPIYLLGNIQCIQGNYKLALMNYRSAIPLAKQNDLFHDTLQIFSGMSTLFLKMGEPDSAIYYSQIVKSGWNQESEIKNLLEAINVLAEGYKVKMNKDSTLKYIELGIALKDSLYRREEDREVQNITFNERWEQKEMAYAQIAFKNKVRLYLLLSGLFVLLMIATILWRNNKHKQKAYALLRKQKQEIEFQKTKVEQTLDHLKSTQSQLIQSEKLASLGELTAGIAHEIQNPLNFVNNFSELSLELAEELKDEIKKPEKDWELIEDLTNDLTQNQEKINHHGKRAAAIVTGMLQHARTSSGKKEPTDLNALADEYLRLSYHGLRAKDADFNAQIVTDFDPSIGMVEVIPQDIGRVFLNIINNAFYAVQQRKIKEPEGYEPTVSVSSKRTDSGIEFRIKDNGTGIPDDVKARIFQPFFTTKPTGQGTGLGLSLAYDIVTKGHGGTLEVESSEGIGSEFIITLPANSIEG